MTAILGIIFPIYGAIAIGYLAVSRRCFSATDMRVLGRYVLDIALPALLFNAVATRDLDEVLRLDYMAVYLIGGLAIITVSYVWFAFAAPDKPRRAIAVMGASSPNSGYIGYPVMLLVFPDLAGVILALNMLVENIFLIPICLILMDLTRPHDGVSIPHRVGRILLGVIKRPMVQGLLLGVTFSLSGFHLPEAAGRLFQMLAASAAALSLFAIGGSLVGLPMQGSRMRATQIAVGKLLVHPALTAAIAAGLAALGWVVLPPDLYAAVILSTAMPMFGIYTVLAQELELEGLASIAMLVATTGGFFTLSAALYWLT